MRPEIQGKCENLRNRFRLHQNVRGLKACGTRTLSLCMVGSAHHVDRDLGGGGPRWSMFLNGTVPAAELQGTQALATSYTLTAVTRSCFVCVVMADVLRLRKAFTRDSLFAEIYNTYCGLQLLGGYMIGGRKAVKTVGKRVAPGARTG